MLFIKENDVSIFILIFSFARTLSIFKGIRPVVAKPLDILALKNAEV